MDTVIVVWDKRGKFFQIWTAEYKDGDGIEHGKRIAEQIGGTFKIVESKLEELLNMYRDAAYTDVTMGGVHFMGVNRSRYREAWEADRKEFFNSKKKTETSL